MEGCNYRIAGFEGRYNTDKGQNSPEEPGHQLVVAGPRPAENRGAGRLGHWKVVSHH